MFAIVMCFVLFMCTMTICSSMLSGFMAIGMPGMVNVMLLLNWPF